MQASHAHGTTTPASVVPTRVKPVARLAATPCRSAMHPAIYKLAVLNWAMLLVVFWVTFFVSANALFMVVVGTFYALVFFGVPFIMSRMAPKGDASPLSLNAFVRGRFDTFCGTVSGFDALLQVILVPFALSIGGMVIGYIIHSARIANGG